MGENKAFAGGQAPESKGLDRSGAGHGRPGAGQARR